MSKNSTVYLITGSTRGIGFAFVEELLARPNTTVIAAVRTVNGPNIIRLQGLPKAKDSDLKVLKLDSAVAEDAVKAVQTVSNQFDIDHIDVVIANAGINTSQESVLATTDSGLREAIEVNTIAPLKLFQATNQLLLAAKAPKFIIISSIAASLQYISSSSISNLSYVISKAAVNVLGIRIAKENEDIVTLLISPGIVETDMVTDLAKQWPALKELIRNKPPISTSESVKKILYVVDNAQKADSGRFIDAIEGKNIPW